MTVEDPRKVDMVGVDNTTGRVVLTIADHLSWNSDDHVLVLQEKLNLYLAFIESGELVEQYPAASGRIAEIAIAFLHSPSDLGNEFLRRASVLVKSAGVEFTYRVVKPS